MKEQEITSIKVGNQKVLEHFKPDKKYIVILLVQSFLIYLGNWLIVWGCGIAVPINELWSWTMYTLVTIGASFLIWLIIAILIFPYFNAIDYTLTTQEIIVNKGLITKKTKIVPYRNVTNIVMRRGLLHRIIGGNNFGAILVETAGQGPQQAHPEQRIVGIMNVKEFTEKIRTILAKMKGQAGISADAETASSLDEEIILKQILGTLKDIEKKL